MFSTYRQELHLMKNEPLIDNIHVKKKQGKRCKQTWALKKAQEKKMDVAGMRMLRWMSGVTKLDRIRGRLPILTIILTPPPKRISE